MAQAQQAGQPNREQPRPYKKNRFSHTANTPYGMGDNYGMGVRAKLGQVRDDTMGMIAMTPKRLKTPPRQVA